MSTIRWRRLGRAIGRLPDGCATRADWAALLGAEQPAVEPFLRRSGTAAVVRRRDASGNQVAWRVVAHGKADLVGVDDETGERIPLAFDDTLLWTLDWTAVAAALRSGLHLSGTQRPIPDALLTWDIGRAALTEHQTAPVILCGAPGHRLGAALDRIAAEAATAGVVLVGDPAVAPPEAVARLQARQYVVVGISDAIAVDERRRLVGIAGPESVLGDLRVRLGLAPVDRPAFQFVRTGARWDLAFAGRMLCVDDQKGLSYISLLLDKPGTPVEVQTLVATVAEVDQHLLQGSKGVVNDRQSRDDYLATARRLQERLQRFDEDHPERARLEAEQDRILEAINAGDALGGDDRQLTTGAQMGRAVGMAMNRAIDAIAAQPDGSALATHLKDSLKRRTGQHPVYRPSSPITWVTAR